MGMRGPSFELRLDGKLLANAGLVTAWYGTVDVTITSGDQEIPTTRVWSDTFSDETQPTMYSMLRPTTGDWPVGELTVVAHSYYPKRPLSELRVEVAPAVDGAPPICKYVSGLAQFGARSFPGGGGRAAYVGLGYVIEDPQGLVWIEVEYTVKGHAHPCRREQLGAWRGTIELDQNVDEVNRIRVTNVLGKTLELLPPFPQGTAPDGPFGGPG